MNAEAAAIVAKLGLRPLPQEGGFFGETWKSYAGSAIYFLLTPEHFSALHRLQTDELWHFYAGDPVEHVQFDSAGDAIETRLLGPEILAGHQPQIVARAHVWQGARLAAPRRGWALVGCTLAPPWEERDFELGDRDRLLASFPHHATIVRQLTR